MKTLSSHLRWTVILLGLIGALNVWSHEPETEAPSLETVVRDNSSEKAASEETWKWEELKPYSLATPAQLLERAPGLISIQHAGGGKANQYFLRGFDLDHGTDLALSVDGVPVNMVSHGHGQGYADLNFIIPETVKTLRVSKGPYLASQGDFATAGAAQFITRDSFEKSSALFQAGSFNTFRGVLIAALPESAAWKGFLAAEFRATDGPFLNPEKLRRLNLLGKAVWEESASTKVTLMLQSSAGGWNASGQIPTRWVNEGRLDFFGAINPSDGGASHRHSVSVALDHQDAKGGKFNVSAYLMRYGLNLFSDFTFFDVDALRGDQIEQVDQRVVSGMSGTYSRPFQWNTFRFLTRAGISLRYDDIENGLFRTEKRQRFDTTLSSVVAQSNLGAFLEEEMVWNSWLKTYVGGRADYFTFNVADAFDAASTGTKEALQFSPKASVVLSPTSSTRVFLNVGRGFHSNDARGVVRRVDAVSPLGLATGYEVGIRQHHLNKRVQWALVGFGIDLGSELVWVGDEGTTEAKGPTRRLGVEAEASWKFTSWLSATGQFTWVHARFRNGDFVPLALPWTANLAVESRWNEKLYGALRFLAVGERPATEDGALTAEGFAFLDAVAGYQWKRVRLELAVRNVTDARWKQAQFATASRLPGESAPVEEIHFTPGTPRMALLSLALEL